MCAFIVLVFEACSPGAICSVVSSKGHCGPTLDTASLATQPLPHPYVGAGLGRETTALQVGSCCVIYKFTT